MNLILEMISKEIEVVYNCKVEEIAFAQLLSLCVRVKLKFNDDFLYKPFDSMPTPNYICFSERTVMFYKRVDLFDCMRNYGKLN
jgi:hypothetical protein